MLRGGRRDILQLPAMFALISHPERGHILFDTGYSEFFFEATKKLPFLLYRKLLPVHLEPENTAREQLKRAGVDPRDIEYVMISHFHGDHIAALHDFPQSKFIYLDKGFRYFQPRKGIFALMKGFVPALVPSDILERSWTLDQTEPSILPPDYFPFTGGWDLFQDGSIWVVELPGHARGQIGVFVNTDEKNRYFLVADACWLKAAYERLILPHPVTRLLKDDFLEYRSTLEKIHHLHQNAPQLHIIPSHCQETLEKHFC